MKKILKGVDLPSYDPNTRKITLHQQKSLFLIWTAKGMIGRSCPPSNLLGAGKVIKRLKEIAQTIISLFGEVWFHVVSVI